MFLGFLHDCLNCKALQYSYIRFSGALWQDKFSVANPRHFNVDPWHFDVEPRHFDVDPQHFGVEPQNFYANPDPSFILMRIWVRLITLKGIQIWTRFLLLIKILRSCQHWFTDHPQPLLLTSTTLHGSILSLHTPQLPIFDCDADPDPNPAFLLWCGSGLSLWYVCGSRSRSSFQNDADPGLEHCKI